jgi:hypothetical protein
MLSKVNSENWTFGTEQIKKYVMSFGKNHSFETIMDNQLGYLLIKSDNKTKHYCCKTNRIIKMNSSDGINRIRIGINDKYFWKQIDSFDQNNIVLAKKIRSSVIKHLNTDTNVKLDTKSSKSIIGIGGEYYVYFPFVSYSSYIGISNHESIVQDANYNCSIYKVNSQNHFVNYDKPSTFPSSQSNSKSFDVILNVLTIHQNHINWIKDLSIDKLIIVTCKPLYKKIKMITKYFKIEKIEYYKNVNSWINIVICRKKYEYVSLGSNCSITHQLNMNKLRIRSYPFDWSKGSISHIISVLDNDFTGYTDMEIGTVSDSHLNYKLEPTLMLGNKYGVKFAHELSGKELLNSDSMEKIKDFETKLGSRVSRFKSLNKSMNKVRFVRIELCKITLGYFEKLDHLISLLTRYCVNFELILILNYQLEIPNKYLVSDSKVKFYLFDKFSPDWRMDHLNWKEILFM